MNATQLRDKVIEATLKVENNPDFVDQAKAMSSLAAQAANLTRLQLLYCQLRKETPKMEFLKP